MTEATCAISLASSSRSSRAISNSWSVAGISCCETAARPGSSERLSELFDKQRHAAGALHHRLQKLLAKQGLHCHALNQFARLRAAQPLQHELGYDAPAQAKTPETQAAPCR